MVGIIGGITGYLVACVLVQPGEVLAWWPGLVQRLNRSSGVSPMDWSKFQLWNNKTTWLCGKCIAGFWTLIFVLISSCAPGEGFASVALAIFCAHIIEKWQH